MYVLEVDKHLTTTFTYIPISIVASIQVNIPKNASTKIYFKTLYIYSGNLLPCHCKCYRPIQTSDISELGTYLTQSAKLKFQDHTYLSFDRIIIDDNFYLLQRHGI